MPRKNRKMENERMDRLQGAGSHGDMHAGDEGVDDPAMSRSQRDDMSATPMHGDRLGEGQSADASPTGGELDMNEDVTAGNRMESQRSRRTNARANDERYDNASGFTGRGAQRGGSMEEAEGTGYTEGSTTDDNSRENPVS